MVQNTDILEEVGRRLREGGVRPLLSSAPRYVRQRLPVELWPPLLIEPRSRADETVTLSEKQPLRVAYDGHRARAPRQLANFEGTISAPENRVYVYHDADVVGRYPTARIDGRYLLPSWFGVDTAFFLHQELFLKRVVPLSRLAHDAVCEPEPARELETAFLLLDERGSYRYGWFHETLPKLQWYEEYCEATGESPPLLVNGPLRPFQRQSLEWMGYGPGDWIEGTESVTRVGRLAVAPHPIRLEGNPSSGFASRVGPAGRRIRENADNPGREFPERVYVSRADASRRRVANEGAVRAALADRGFEPFEPGRLSLAEQVALFAGAEVIVGLHGLAYYNLMFCEAGTALLELFASDGVDESYFVVANELGMEYDCLECASITDERTERPINRDVRVDIDELTALVDATIERRGESS